MSKNTLEKYDIIIGLEIHVETKTKSKMFCSCSRGQLHDEPNTHTCPVCLGLPGALPVPNKYAIQLCILMGLATHCSIAREIYFDRKHYYYPDLAKGYQISQYKNPLCYDGYVDVPSGARVELERIHQEEDVAKSLHLKDQMTGEEYTLVDYNRSGVPLIEIVTKPCIHSATDAKDYATKIRQIVRFLDISDGDMEKGQMRCEPNISIQEKGKWEYKDGAILPIGDYKLNPKVEVKNIGSITAVEKAIDYEVNRMIEALENGETLRQETRGWNANKNVTEFQRAKETADDYRYMPEPDIPVIDVTEEDIEEVSTHMVELADDKVKRYVKDWGITEYAAQVISATKEDATYFENLQKELAKKLSPEDAAKEASNWLMGSLYALANKLSKSPTDLDVSIEDFAKLIIAFKEGIFTKNRAEEILTEHIENGLDIDKEIEQSAKAKEESGSQVEQIVKDVIAKNDKAVADYKSGKVAVIGFLVGQVMQATKGTANPADVKNILEKELQ